MSHKDRKCVSTSSSGIAQSFRVLSRSAGGFGYLIPSVAGLHACAAMGDQASSLEFPAISLCAPS